MGLGVNKKCEKELLERHCDYLANLLNEVLNGFPAKIKNDQNLQKEELSRLLDRISRYCSQHDKDTPYHLSADDAQLLLTCSRLCSIEFTDSEFQTRLGESLQSAADIEQLLGSLANAS